VPFTCLGKPSTRPALVRPHVATSDLSEIRKWALGTQIISVTDHQGPVAVLSFIHKMEIYVHLSDYMALVCFETLLANRTGDI